MNGYERNWEGRVRWSGEAPGEGRVPLEARTVGLFTLLEDTGPIHAALFVGQRHRRFISCGALLLCGLRVLKVHLKTVFCISGFPLIMTGLLPS